MFHVSALFLVNCFDGPPSGYCRPYTWWRLQLPRFCYSQPMWAYNFCRLAGNVPSRSSAELAISSSCNPQTWPQRNATRPCAPKKTESGSQTGDSQTSDQEGSPILEMNRNDPFVSALFTAKEKSYRDSCQSSAFLNHFLGVHLAKPCHTFGYKYLYRSANEPH